MAHGHNVIALVLWVVLFRRRAWAAVGPLCVLVLGLAVLLSGITLPWATHLGGDAALGRDLIDAGRSLAPGLSPGLAMRVTLTFVALQAVHYAVWLRLVPQEDVRAEGTPTFAMSARSLVRDFSPLALVAIGVMAALVLAASFFDLYGTRDLYLSLAAFHAWLELVMLVFLVMARRTASSAAAQVRPLSFYKKRSKLCCSGVLE